MTRFRRKSAALNLVRIIPVWHRGGAEIMSNQNNKNEKGGRVPSSIMLRRVSRG